jgi:hypothetical protein
MSPDVAKAGRPSLTALSVSALGIFRRGGTGARVDEAVEDCALSTRRETAQRSLENSTSDGHVGLDSLSPHYLLIDDMPDLGQREFRRPGVHFLPRVPMQVALDHVRYLNELLPTLGSGHRDSPVSSPP